MEDNIGLFLTKRAFLNPDKEVIVEVEKQRRFTYKQLNSGSNKIANALLKQGVQVGDRVAILAMNGVEFIEIYFALAKIGAIMVPLNWRLVASELEYILKDSGATTLFFGEDFTVRAEELHCRVADSGISSDDGKAHYVENWIAISSADECPDFANNFDVLCSQASMGEVKIRAEGDNNLFIMYTSGTTGFPKGVIHTHQTMIAAAYNWVVSGDLHYQDRVLQAMPFYHVAALFLFTGSLLRGSTNIVMRSFDPATIFSVIERERISTGLLVPTMLGQMLASEQSEKCDYSSVNWFSSGAAPVPVFLIEKYAGMGIEIRQGYGLTESCGAGCLITPESALLKAGSCGPAFFHTDVRVVRDDGSDAAPGEDGEIIMRGRHVMKGYWNLPEATQDTIRDGWLYTGDMAHIDNEGFVFIHDRKKDMIISGGENVYPAEIEGVLIAHPDVADVAVIGVESAKWGESVAAIVVPRQDANLEEGDIKSFCADKMASFKRPRMIIFTDAIPRNPSGKILKNVLRDTYTESALE